MAGSVNKVILVGNLGADPEVRTFPSGAKFCNLSVATSERWRDRETGENRQRTEWHRVTVFAEPAVRFAEQYLQKGNQVYIEGKLETRKWTDQSGQDRYSTEVVLRPFRSELLSLARGDDSFGGSQFGQSNPPDRSRQYGGNKPSGNGGGMDGGFPEGDDNLPEPDDDIPF